VSDLHNASVILSGDHAVIQLGEDHFLPRLQSYLDLAAALRERVADIDSVDLRFDDRIYVTPLRSRKSEVRSQKSEVRSQRSEVRSQRSEVRSQKSEVRSQKSEGRRRK